MIFEQVVLVDEHDARLGLMDKLEAHRGKGTLHRAVSVLLYRKRKGIVEMLLQQRSKGKPLWPLFWSNTVCTHPRDGEAPVDCAVRRLKEEMGIVVKTESLHFLFKLLYQARYDENFSEHELDHVFVGEWDGKFSINSDEANDAKWMEWQSLSQDVYKHDEVYTPWFKMLVKNKKIQGVFH